MTERAIYQLKYRDSSDELSERLISTVVPDGPDMISAHCHMRNAQRSFHLSKVIQLLDVESGEVIDDPWAYFGVSRGSPQSLIIHPPLNSALRALKYLTLRLRGTPRKREYQQLVLLVQQTFPHLDLSDADAETAIRKLWIPEDEDYQADLAAIPSNLRAPCRHIAIAIAKGSGRRPVNPAVWQRIDLEFPQNGQWTWGGDYWPPLYEGDDYLDKADSNMIEAPVDTSPTEPVAIPRKMVHIDPTAYFSHWHYIVRPELWCDLGVELREYIDREKSQKMRNSAKEAGETDKSKIAKMKAVYLSHVVSSPPLYDFHEGSIFYHHERDSAVQVVVDDDGLEVHLLERRQRVRAFHIAPEQLAEWLCTGVEPTASKITPGQSKREIWKYLIQRD